MCLDEVCGKAQHECPRRAALTQHRVAVREHAIGEQHCKALEPCLAGSASFSRAPVPSACRAATHPLIPPPHRPRVRSWKRSGYHAYSMVFHTAKVALCSLALTWPLDLLQGVFGNLGFLFLFPAVGSPPFFSPSYVLSQL